MAFKVTYQCFVIFMSNVHPFCNFYSGLENLFTLNVFHPKFPLLLRQMFSFDLTTKALTLNFLQGNGPIKHLVKYKNPPFMS